MVTRASSVRTAGAATPPLTRGRWWLTFSVATILLSICFQAFKAFTVLPDWANGLKFLAVILLLVLLMTLLVYDGYAKERLKGTTMRSFGLFEAWYARQYPGLVPSEPSVEERQGDRP